MAISSRLKGRYELRQILAKGGMGVVYKAHDSVMKRHVAVKTLLDITDPAGLQLFQKECDVLASMTHPNIIEIYDAGQFEDEGVTRPFLVMPLLPGVTLDKLIRSENQRLTVPRSIDIVCQACRGLQAAHEMGLVHRDVKPSNIFVMEDDSVKIIDFGVAYRLETSRTIGRRGTLLYMAPEQIEMKPVSALSDIFSLGVVCYETLTRKRPFERSTENSVANAILNHVPVPVSELNPEVNPAVSQAIHKAMAKQAWHRYATAREFAETLQKAVRNEPIEVFNPSRIRPRLQRASDAFERGDFQFASEILGELEAEGHLDPSIRALRGRIEEAIRRKTTAQLMETARLRIEEEEYSLALQKIQEVLQLDPTHAEAQALKTTIEIKRTDREVDQWLQLAREHTEACAFAPAREALQRVLQLRPTDADALQLRSDLERKEQEYARARQEKEQLYHSAAEAGQRGDITAALTKLERVLELDRRLPDPAAPERAKTYQNLYDQLHSEHEAIQRAYTEAKDLLGGANFSEALAVCNAQLAKYPGNALFQALKLDIEERYRQVVSARTAEVDRTLAAEPDLDRRIAMLRELAAEYPGEAHFEQLVARTEEKRNLVESIVAKARLYEQQAQFGEALAQWEILKTVYDRYPGLAAEVERVSAKREAGVEAVIVPAAQAVAAPSASSSPASPGPPAIAEDLISAQVTIAVPEASTVARSQVEVVEGSPTLLDSADRKGSSSDFQVRPSRARKWIWYFAAVLLAILAVAAVIVANLLRPVPAERALGSAVVAAARTDVMEGASASSKRLTTFGRGTRLNVLAELLTPTQLFIRVQLVSPKKNLPPGFVRTADLGDWNSNDARIAWGFLAVLRPAEGASEQKRREFAEQLRAFANRFSGTPEACNAVQERTRLLLGIVDEHRKAGEPQTATEEDLKNAKEALATAGCPSDEALLRQLQELSASDVKEAPQAPPVSPEDAEKRRQLKVLEDREYDLARKAEFEEMCVLADQIERLDHKAAARWRTECKNLLDSANPKKQ